MTQKQSLLLRQAKEEFEAFVVDTAGGGEPCVGLKSLYTLQKKELSFWGGESIFFKTKHYWWFWPKRSIRIIQ